MGEVLDLTIEEHKYKFVLSLVNAYCLLHTMAQALPILTGRFPLFMKTDRPDGRCNFLSYAEVPSVIRICQASLMI